MNISSMAEKYKAEDRICGPCCCSSLTRNLYAGISSIPTVSRRLGHSSIATTSKIYIHAIQSADEIASNALENKLKLEKRRDDED